MGRPLSTEEVGSRLRARFGDDVEVVDTFGHAVATVPSSSYHDVVRFLRDDPVYVFQPDAYVLVGNDHGGLDREQLARFQGRRGIADVVHFHALRDSFD